MSIKEQSVFTLRYLSFKTQVVSCRYSLSDLFLDRHPKEPADAEQRHAGDRRNPRELPS